MFILLYWICVSICVVVLFIREVLWHHLITIIPMPYIYYFCAKHISVLFS